MNFYRSIPVIFILVTGLSCNKRIAETGNFALPQPDHIILVWFENKGFDRIVGNADAPYFNSQIDKGTLFLRSYALTHPSYPNYISFFGGQSNGINSNNCINGKPLTADNLYSWLRSAGKSFAWYSEGLPATGSEICNAGLYAERHNPVTIFQNVPDSLNKKFEDLPSDYNRLENVVCITPNLMNDMHDGPIMQGDTWLKNNLSGLMEWCKTHNSIFIIYFDESETDADNRIPVLAVGEHVRSNYMSNVKYDHYSWTKTILRMFNAPYDRTDDLKKAVTVSDAWQP